MMVEIEFNKGSQSFTLTIEVPSPAMEGNRELSKNERIGRAFAAAHDELHKAWALATQDNEALDRELAEKASEIALRKAAKIEVNLD